MQNPRPVEEVVEWIRREGKRTTNVTVEIQSKAYVRSTGRAAETSFRPARGGKIIRWCHFKPDLIA